MKRRHSRPPRGERFSAARQPAAKRMRWLPSIPKRKGVDRREVQRLAEIGTSFENIVAALRLGPCLERDPKLREEVDSLVEWHLARARVGLARRLWHEGVGSGRTAPLLALGRTHRILEDEPQARPEEHGVVERLGALLDRAVAEARKR